MSEYHEPESELTAHGRDLHRALASLKEEIEAVDWYNQRWEACKDETLRAVLAHNRDEEIEHACMTLEWLRRNMTRWDEVLRTYLFTSGDITAIEAAREAAEASAKEPAAFEGSAIAPALRGGAMSGRVAQHGDLGIGSRRRAR